MISLYKKKIKDGWILGPRGGFRGPEFFCGHEEINTRLPSFAQSQVGSQYPDKK